MSFLADTPICDLALETDLGIAFEAHASAYCDTSVEMKWLNVMRHRAQRLQDPLLVNLTDWLLALLSKPCSAGVSFKNDIVALYNQAGWHAYPLAWKLRDEHHAIADLTRDYTLGCFDSSMIRAIEDEAAGDRTTRMFVNEMMRRLSAATNKPGHEVFPSVFEVYSEALVYHLLKQRGGDRLRIDKIPESKKLPSPDFECTLRVGRGGHEEHDLTFYVEVKTLDIVNAPQRLPKMLDEGLDAQIEIEEQRNKGMAIATAYQEIAPYRPYDKADDYERGVHPDYDPRSVRQVIEVLIKKAAGNFKAAQFSRGPTFALASLLRLPLLGQGASTLTPFFYDPLNGGACVSGVLWHMAFGQLRASIHRSPDFEGHGTLDGELQCAGLLVDPSLNLPTCGLIAFYYEQGAYRFEGLYDEHWKDEAHGWSNLEVEALLDALCGDFNDRRNSMAHKYALYKDRRRA